MKSLVIMVCAAVVAVILVSIAIRLGPKPLVYEPPAYEPMVLLIEDGSAMMYIEDEWIRMCRCPEGVPE